MNGFLLGGAGVTILALGVLWRKAGDAPAGGINTADAAFVERGRLIYARECAICHGRNLKGQVPDWRSRLPDGSVPAPPHDETGHTWHHPDEQLFEVTKLGRKAVSGGAMDSNMPGFADKLTDREIWAVLSYIKKPVARTRDAAPRHDQSAYAATTNA